MSAALAAHPEWGGDWQMPAGLQQIDIDPRTGLLAALDSPFKRAELFINGTAPTTTSDAPSIADPGEEDDALEGDEQDGVMPLPPTDIPTLPMPDATPAQRPRTVPRLESRAGAEADGSRLAGVITLDVDPTTGLLAAPTCPVIRTRTFVIGTEPRRRCGSEYHSGRSIQPSGTRPRTVSPP